jgi:murein DD-endopeptidase MepM/ murein hydrolase activator NlpD
MKRVTRSISRLFPRGVTAAAVLAAALLLFCACGGGSLTEITSPSPQPTVAAAAVTPLTTQNATLAPSPVNVLYTVQAGDTLGVIAGRFGVSVDAIVSANGLADAADLSVGQVLTIPGVLALPAPSRTSPAGTTAADSPIGIHLAMPIAGACLTTDDDQMPNAPRAYRSGVHEGLDFFTSYACVPVAKDTPALAAADGVVIRADHDYRALTQKEIDDLEAQSVAQGYTDEGALDKFRGRQLWIDHGGGIVTRYCHLAAISSDVQVGTHVTQSQVIGYTGDSGTPESASNPDFEIHLHFEIRVGRTYLGAGLDPLQTRNTYERVFGLPLTQPSPAP